MPTGTSDPRTPAQQPGHLVERTHAWKGPDSSLLTRRLSLLRAALFLADTATLAGALVLAALLRFGSAWQQDLSRALPSFQVVAPLYLVCVLLSFRAAGLYRISDAWTFRSEVRDLFRAAGLVAFATIAGLYAVRQQDVSRLFIVAFFGLSSVGLVGSRLLVRQWFRRLREADRRLRHLLLVGSGASAEYFATKVAATPEAGVHVLGFVSDDSRRVHEYPRLGSFDDLPALLTSHVIDEVAICLPLERWSTIEAITELAEEQGKAVRIPIDRLNRVLSRGRVEQLHGLPVLSMSPTPDETASRWVKRIIDVAVAAVGLVITAPLLAVVALLVLVRDGRPVLFSQNRVGLHGRLFRIHKFRTMVHDAEALQADLIDRNERRGPAFKLRDDPRLTRLGRVLRRLSLDELPQLWNVLVGEMSLVGPRPPLPREVERYDAWHRRRLSMPPGMTGLWQISARTAEEFDDWVTLDMRYIDSWSLKGDARILMRTVPAVLRMTGA